MPLRSMTGFGAATRESAGVAAGAEVRSVNHRHLSISLRAPAALDARQAELEAVVRERVARGSVSVTVTLRRARGGAPARIAADVLADYLSELRGASERLGLRAEDVRVADLLRLPGVVEDAPARSPTDEEFAVAAAAVRAAVEDLVAMREREGAALARDLGEILDQVERGAAEIERRLPESVAAHMERLRERLAALLCDHGGVVPEETLAREIAVLADRSDVAEELQRLRSHVAQWRAALGDGGVVGRRLDFLAQELGREANTIGSKSSDVAVSAAVVDLKVAVERLKEQAANVE